MSNYERLLSHIEHHNTEQLRNLMIAWAESEDARTICAAIKQLSKRRLQRRLARMLES